MAKMDAKVLSTVCEKVYQQFPEVKGVKPKIQDYSGDKVLLIFQTSVTTADGKKLPRTVRAVVEANGKINKLTTSR